MPQKEVTVVFSPSLGKTQSRSYKNSIPSSGNPLRDCQTIFRMLNRVETESQMIDLNERSMSPGDGVVIDGKVYRCGGLGWTEVKDLSQLKGPGLFNLF